MISSVNSKCLSSSSRTIHDRLLTFDFLFKYPQLHSINSSLFSNLFWYDFVERFTFEKKDFDSTSSNLKSSTFTLRFDSFERSIFHPLLALLFHYHLNSISFTIIANIFLSSLNFLSSRKPIKFI